MLQRLLASTWVVLFLWISGCTPESAGTFSISGTVTDGSGAALRGVSVVLTGDNSGLVVSDENGAYTISNLADGSYTVRPSKAGYSFSPSRKAVTIAGADAAGIDFAGSATPTTPAAAYSVSGKVVDTSGAGLAGVTLSAQRSGATAVMATSSADGSFALVGLPNGTYSITPMLASYTFVPDSATEVINGASKSGLQFVGTFGSSPGPAPQFTLSGRVLNSTNQGVVGVTLTLTDGINTKTANTLANGNYSFTGLVAGKYVVTPSLAGSAFDPASRAVDIVAANVTGINFATVPPPTTSFTVSGSVVLASGAGVPGVTVTLSGATSASAMTNPNGAFTFANVANGNYTVTPALTGYTFDVASQPANVNGADVTGLKFTATPPPDPTYTVSGRVTNADTGAGIAGVTVNLNGVTTTQNGGTVTAVGTATTDSTGAFTFTGVRSGSYAVTPSLTGYTFTPGTANITVASANVTNVAFSGRPPVAATYSVSGRVTLAGNVPLPGVTLTLSGAASATATTNATGNYTFTGIAAGSYTVTPSLTGYTFAPPDAPVTITNANVTNVNFGATAPALTFTVSGRVTTGTAPGTALAGVTIALSGAGSGTTTTDASGNYSFASLAAGTYVLTPSLTGYSFTPPTLSVNVTSADVPNRDFSASTVTASSYSLSGAITVGGAALSGATVALSGATTASTTTNANGAFTFAGLGAGNYTVTPSMAGYTFTPGNKSVSITTANATAVDFTADITGPITRNYTLFIVPGTLTVSGTGGAAIPAWSFTDDAVVPKFPGVRLIANEGDTVNIMVTNNHTIPHNFQIRGITDALDAAPIAPGATKSYTFVADKAGSYLYYDSLNNVINRSMGLYGALVVAPPGGGNTAWQGGPAYSFERVWVVSDLDKPNWNDVASAGGAVNTTNYRANYFVINGMGGRAAMMDRTGTAIDGRVGQSALVRILNAGQYPQTFHFHANHVKVLSVNGVRRTAPFRLLDVLSVPPLGTTEVLFELNQPGEYPMHNHTAQMETANGTYLNGVGTAIYIAP